MWSTEMTAKLSLLLLSIRVFQVFWCRRYGFCHLTAKRLGRLLHHHHIIFFLFCAQDVACRAINRLLNKWTDALCLLRKKEKNNCHHVPLRWRWQYFTSEHVILCMVNTIGFPLQDLQPTVECALARANSRSYRMHQPINQSIHVQLFDRSTNSQRFCWHTKWLMLPCTCCSFLSRSLDTFSLAAEELCWSYDFYLARAHTAHTH